MYICSTTLSLGKSLPFSAVTCDKIILCSKYKQIAGLRTPKKILLDLSKECESLHP